MSPSLPQKVLIANRGEIAVRIAQTCRELDIRTVAVYSSADENALHVRAADEAYCVGPPPALDSYLRIDALLDVARRSGADAVHPGYGFLAENPEFARAVEDAGLVWVGPPAEVIALMGDKVAAKDLARSVGVPTVPGYDGRDGALDCMRAEAERIGYPVMLKAAAGGGGKGMRAVSSADQLPAALEGAQREARAAFGDDRVFLEKLIERPRHIEIQVMLDSQGNAVYLGERDCSIQRRHQKVIEEAPSPVLTPNLRALMGQAALRLCRAAGYRNAGTVEFLFSADHFYFLEMNTRIQVEHPVTEMVTGLDLIRLQLLVAAGGALPIDQLDVRLRGHAIEARVYAEDARAGFLPAAGRVDVFQPPQGPGIRNDVGVSVGSEVTPYYDPMVAKLIAHAETRTQAIARLADALRRYRIAGPTTNLAFLSWIVAGDEFRAGRADITFIDRSWHPADSALPPVEVLAAAAIADALASSPVAASDPDPFSPWRQATAWRARAIPRRFRYQVGDQERSIEVTPCDAASWRVSSGDYRADITVLESGAHALRLSHAGVTHELRLTTHDGRRTIEWRGDTYSLLPASELSVGSTGTAGLGSGGPTAPMPGTVVKVAVRPGQRVSAHEPLVVLEAMKMEHVVEAAHDGVIREVLVKEGDPVVAGSPLVEIEP